MTMNAESKNVRDAFADQLASFDDKLHATVDDVEMLAEIQDGIGNLLASSGDSEAEIRRVLQEHYEKGELRKETFQLVKSMLDAYVTEAVPTTPTPEAIIPGRQDPPLEAPGKNDADEFATTQRIESGGVIEADAVIDLGTPGPVGMIDAEISKDAALIPMTTDFDPLAADEHKETIAPPDIRRDAGLVDTPEVQDDQFGSTTIIPVDAFSETDADSRVQIGSLLRDRFLLHERVSGGSMGVVYKAMDRRLAEAGSDSQWVAIKVLSPQLAENAQALRALQQEAAKGRCLVHPHIVRFMDLDRDGDLYFIVMEWLEGRTLADILDSNDRKVIDHDAAFRIVRQIGDALVYAHNCGIVHADVKPGNIMILPNGDARLFDFGVARVQQTRPDDGFDPGVLGAMTPAYSSMQVLTGDEPVASDDVFSLACLLYRLVAGYRVFGPRNAAEASNEGMTPQRVKGFTDDQWSALKKALSYSRITRFVSVTEFLDALEDVGPETIDLDVPLRFVADPDRGTGRWTAILATVLVASAVFAWQGGYLDSYIDRYLPASEPLPRLRDNDTPALPEPAVVATEPAAAELSIEAADTAATSQPVATDDLGVNQPVDPDSVGPASTLVDFSTLPPPSMVVPISVKTVAAEAFTIAIREDSEPAIIDFVRDGELSTELNVRLEEVGFSGNRSPWAAGQYALSNSGLVRFPVGQARGRITLTMAPDPLREADQASTLRVRELEYAESELAIVEVLLEDDDQRNFEARLPVNTVAFAASQASIRESDPAVQLDIVRFNPDDSPVVVAFNVQDITATDGEDYFAPGSHEIAFGPRQRSARLLIPVVKDSIVEGDEAFVVELESEQDLSAMDIYQRIVVMIRDSGPQDGE